MAENGPKSGPKNNEETKKMFLNIRESFLLILATVCCILAGCQKEVKQGTVLSDYTGDYVLESIFWRGDVDIDINKDGIKEANWMSEFEGVPGYVKSWAIGKVTVKDDKTLQYVSVIPLFVSTKLDGDTFSHSISYYEVVNDGKYYPGNKEVSQKFETSTFNASADENVYGMEYCTLYVDVKSSDTYDLVAYCRILNPEDLSVIEDTVHYIFKKVK